MRTVSVATVARMRDSLFIEGEQARRKASRFWLLLPLSAVIASAGVVADSTATVIGAMIVAPLMVPILGIVLAVVLADRRNLVRSVVLVVAGAASVVLVGMALGLVVQVDIVAATNGQVAGRVSPRLVDLMAALATGAVGAVALVRDDIADTLPGVAIAISLVPPLAVVGLTLESGDIGGAAGALLLFTTNVTAILASGLIVMTLFGVHRHLAPIALDDGDRPAPRRRTVALLVAMTIVVLAVPLGFGSQRITRQLTLESDVRNAVEPWATSAGWDVVDVSAASEVVKVIVTGPLPEPDVAGLDTALAAEGVTGVEIDVELVPARTVRVGM